MGKLIIVGHKNPDTDSIVSAIVAQEYFSKVLRQEAQAYRAGNLNNETKFVLQSLDMAAPELIASVSADDSLVLVDHNETTQIFEQLDLAQVEYIVDHHKLALRTDKPINCRVEPIGSTSSLLAKMFQEKGVDISEKIAKLLLAGILSDTLNMTSPTTTDEDRTLVMKLNTIAKVDIEEFVGRMFKAKSSLEGVSVSEIISLDYKVFNMGNRKVGIGTWETTCPESVNKKEEIQEALREKKEVEKLDLIFFMVVDILKQNSELYIIGELEQLVAEKVFGGKAKDGLLLLPGVVSRKKQIVPQLTAELTK